LYNVLIISAFETNIRVRLLANETLQKYNL